MKIKVLAKGAKIGSASFEYEPGYEFISDPACSEYDWLVVYPSLPLENLKIAFPPKPACVFRLRVS